jgi:catechol 2,3-dioxygenase-like lactoylglutathione lyase family enzyme
MANHTPGYFPHSYYHVGLVVPDIDAAIAELGGALGLHFNPPHESVYGPDTITVAYAQQGPPYFELVQGAPGSQWDTIAGPHLDHVGYFSHDLEADVATLEAAGLPVDVDGRQYGAPFTYHHAPAGGMRVELVSEAIRERLLRSLQR